MGDNGQASSGTVFAYTVRDPVGYRVVKHDGAGQVLNL